jgi:UDPglucose--hexose-1-phosphate uridylyltransferase
MSELRHDPVTGRDMIVAAGRATRPHQLLGPSRTEEDAGGQCPFCPGHEDMTPTEICRTGDGRAGEPGWRVRVFPNLYPIVGGEHGLPGAHEVVVLSPDHWRSFAELDDDAAVEVFAVVAQRIRALFSSGHEHVVALINHRRAAGASLPHPHAQLVALDFVPPEVLASGERFVQAGRDLVLDDLADAHRLGLLVTTAGSATGWCPAGSWLPFVVRVSDADGAARFDRASDDSVASVARATRDTLTRLATVLDDPPYNLVVRTAPASSNEGFQWHVEVTARVSVTAGFEEGTGMFVNTVPPERAASLLRGEA